MIFYFVTQAALEARAYDTVRRNLDWITSTPDGRGYMWWEYRDADPELQIDHGATPWLIYGEPLTLLVHNMLGYRPEPDRVVIRPRLLPELAQVSARLRLGPHRLNLTIHNGGPVVQRVTVDGQEWLEISTGRAVLALPTADTDVEMWLSAAA